MVSDKRPVQDLLALMVAKGIAHAVVSPGSRNAPFSISLHNHPAIRTFTIVDERSAAFFAMGIAQQVGHPVALFCTSGTAVLNFSPAIAEAFYQRIPLLVITADRPVEWIDQGEGQSIRQRMVYQNFVKASFEIMEETTHPDSAWHNNRILGEAIRLCTAGVPGPVHVNFPLREPLYGTAASVTHKVKVVDRLKTTRHLPLESIVSIRERLSSCQKILILAGQARHDRDLETALAGWAALPQCVVMTEAHSNLSDPHFITTIDRLVMGYSSEEQEYLVPDVLITFGHNIISRKIKEYLRKGETEHWHIDVSGEDLDTFKNLCRIIPLAPVDFFSSVIPDPETGSNFSETLHSRNNHKRLLADQYLEKCAWSDLKVFNTICKRIPSGSDVQLGNSSVIRYVLLFDTRGDIRHSGNRGVAGVDGSSSTAVGASYATKNLTTLLTGDIAFFYDSNAFWNNYVSESLRIIVINNGGGGIFRIIDGPSQTPALETFFEATHTRSAEGLAAMYKLEFKQVSNEEELSAGLDWLYSRKSCSVLEIMTPREENDRVLKDYFKSLNVH